ncbi:MAG: hypothetical protein EAZ19_04375 [Oscillatoriales cyanobacterium]|nr:MAG: hypothetical protein EAZ19_04375 [Oscillatoriales cyanobacterium]
MRSSSSGVKLRSTKNQEIDWRSGDPGTNGDSQEKAEFPLPATQRKLSGKGENALHPEKIPKSPDEKQRNS